MKTKAMMDTAPPTTLEDESGAFQIRAARIGKPSAPRTIDSPEETARFWREVIARRAWFDPEKETVIALSLSPRLTLKSWHVVSIGGLKVAPVGCVDIFRPAILSAAARMILVHNHPSGNATPSECDFTLTRRAHAAGVLLGISLEDHIIIAGDAYTSLRVSMAGDLWPMPPKETPPPLAKKTGKKTRRGALAPNVLPFPHGLLRAPL